jgi:hypothetical protein
MATPEISTHRGGGIMSLKGRISKIAAAMVELLKVRRIKPGNLMSLLESRILIVLPR